MCTSPRRAPHSLNYSELDSSDEHKSNENTSSDDQDREEAAERSMIDSLERGKSMNKDEHKTIEEKQEHSSFVQTTTTTQADFHDGDSLLSQASSVLPEVTAASSEVTGSRTPQNTVKRTRCTSNKESDKRKREKENSKKKKTSRVDAEMETFVNIWCFTVMPA